MLEMSKNIPLRQRWDYHRHFPILSLSLSLFLKTYWKAKGNGREERALKGLDNWHNITLHNPLEAPFWQVLWY